MFRSFKSELVSQFCFCPLSCILGLYKYASANFGTLLFFISSTCYFEVKYGPILILLHYYYFFHLVGLGYTVHLLLAIT